MLPELIFPIDIIDTIALRSVYIGRKFDAIDTIGCIILFALMGGMM
jgi:hypothetical protein